MKRALASAARRAARAFSTSNATPKSSTMGVVQLGALAGIGAGVAYHSYVQDIRTTAAYASLVDNVLMPLLRSLDAEQAHNLGIRSAALGLAPRDPDVDSAPAAAVLSTKVCGLDFRSPIGLAAGFDKQAEAMEGLLNAGFGFVEVGTVTPQPQPGNPQPRMFRLPQDKGVINRFGFNSDGMKAVQERLAAFWAHAEARGAVPGNTLAGQTNGIPRGVLGVNIGKNKEGDAVQDYTAGTVALAPFADYLTVNISSPNTPGLRALQGREQLRQLLTAVMQARDGLPWGKEGDPVPAQVNEGSPTAYMYKKLLHQRKSPPPVFVKIAPDVTDADVEDIAQVVLACKVDGVIVTNTTIARPSSLAHQDTAKETGGLSGQPLFERSTEVLATMHKRLGGKVPLIGVGGVGSAEQAYAKFKAGASLVQVYTALAYEGTTLVPRIKAGLVAGLRADGYTNVSQAVGAAQKKA